jgi:hypothetical protein
MLENKDYCDYETCHELMMMGLEPSVHYDSCHSLLLYEAQKWLREEKGIHIAPRIYLYHDINLDEQTSWECTIYVEWSAIYTIGKSLTYEDALLLGIKEAVKILKEKDGIS